MRNLSIPLLLAAVVAMALGPQASAVTKQTAGHVFNGRNYLWLEAESYASLGEDLDDNGWKIVSKESPIVAAGGEDILPASSNVSGTALLDDAGGPQHQTAVYEVQFATAGTYQFYSRHTMFDLNGDGSYGSEDSIFISPAFNKNSSTDWIGFEGLNFDDQDPEVDIPSTGYALDPDGFKPDVGDSENDGWYAIRDWRIKSAGVLQGASSQDPDLQNGLFSWYNRPALVSTGPGGGFDSDYGFKTEYIVTEDQVGQTLTFEIGTREPYGVFDGFLFIQDDDVNLLDIYTQAEVDAVLVPVVDECGAGDPDLNCDGNVDGLDLGILLGAWDPAVAAAMGISQGAVPEPTSAVLVLSGVALAALRRRR